MFVKQIILNDSHNCQVSCDPRASIGKTEDKCTIRNLRPPQGANWGIVHRYWDLLVSSYAKWTRDLPFMLQICSFAANLNVHHQHYLLNVYIITCRPKCFWPESSWNHDPWGMCFLFRWFQSWRISIDHQTLQESNKNLLGRSMEFRHR